MTETIGFIGLGAMGAGMARNLVRAGHEVTVFNRSPAKAAPLVEAAGLMIYLEPLNTRIDHPIMFMDTAMEGLDIVEEVNSPAVRLLYDVYHSTVMGEDWREVLKRGHLIGYVQVADTNGRHEPGTGDINWQPIMSTLREQGYQGAIGLEYFPTQGDHSSLAQSRKALGL